MSDVQNVAVNANADEERGNFYGRGAVRGTPRSSNSKGSQARRWCYTINNYSAELPDRIRRHFDILGCTYAICGLEVAATGTRHIQGYVHFKKRQRFGVVKKATGGTAHLAVARGTDKENHTYCSKEGNVAWELGEPAEATTENGGCNKLADSIDDYIKVRKTHTTEQTLGEYPRFRALYVRHAKHLEACVSKIQSAGNLIHNREQLLRQPLRLWQSFLEQYLAGPINKREIRWYFDDKGNTGKSWMAKYLSVVHDALVLDNMKGVDGKYLYQGQRIVVFDFVRSNEDHINYGLIEAVKNGLVVSTKYEPQMKVHDNPHVVVFANFMPDFSKLSQDRWKIKDFMPCELVAKEETVKQNGYKPETAIVIDSEEEDVTSGNTMEFQEGQVDWEFATLDDLEQDYKNTCGQDQSFDSNHELCDSDLDQFSSAQKCKYGIKRKQTENDDVIFIE